MEGQTIEPAASEGKGELEQRVERLERENDELRRANAALAREQLGKRDAAAASMLVRIQTAEKRADKVEKSISWRITAPIRVFKPLFAPLVEWLDSARRRLQLRLRRGS